MSAPTTTPPPAAVRRVLIGAAIGATLAAGATLATASPATAAPIAAAPVAHTAVAHEAAAPASAAAVNTVKVTDALLRAQPNTSSTKLDVSQPGRVVDLYCWVANPPTGAYYIWFKAHPHGSKYTGWMRADLINWATYPNPGRC